ncbi:MAG TPA: DUF4349 domain-containing protein [Mycobacteriales bacterium]|nr:DUF4349 domain-containing protein [Mycobacteriales bacterium]
MIPEDLLERGLASAADSYELPPESLDDLRELLTPRAPRRLPRPHLSRRGWLATTAAALVGLIVVALALGSGSNHKQNLATTAPSRDALGGVSAVNGSVAGGSGGSSAGGTVAGPNAAAAPPVFGAAGGARVPQPAPGLPTVDTSKVVKTGEMDLQADKGQVPNILNRVIGIATVVQGYVSDSHTDEGIDPNGLVTLRVPVGKFETTIAQIRSLPAKVASQQISGADVTSKYVDLQARVTALQATRSTYERLLSRANSIGDILSIQTRITDVQTQIEQLQGQLRVLDDQTSYGTLTVTVDQKTAPAPARVVHHQSGMSKAVHRSVDRFVNGIEAIVGVIGPILLVLLVVGLGVVVLRVGYRVVRRQLV